MKALVPLDGSDNSLRIFSTVRSLLALQPAIEIHLLEVLDPHSVKGRTEHTIEGIPSVAVGKVSISSPGPRLVESHGAAMERVAGETSYALKDLAAREIPEAQSFVHVAWSDQPSRAIKDLSDELDVDVVVMATHGRSGLSHMVAGSVTEAVIRHSHRPVLVQGPAAAAVSNP